MSISEKNITAWLPTTKKEVEMRGWDELDVILFTGDAYIDHPSFGGAVIGRLLESLGLRVAIVPQPNWQDDLRDFKKLGKPQLFFGVTSGCMDSMVNHYTANKRLRSDDAYTPDNKAGFRPDYATTVYSKILKDIYPDVPVIIGGIEASLRRLTHYDYWSNTLMPSILIDSKADLLVYGMGEKPIKEIVTQLKNGIPIKKLQHIAQTAFSTTDIQAISVSSKNCKTLISHEECLKDKYKFADCFKSIEEESNKYDAAILIQKTGTSCVIVNPPYKDITEAETDSFYDLPYTRLPHPKYNKRGVIPAYEMIRHSVNIHRGCFGGCSFCTISAHQGKFITSRSEKSILKEIDTICEMPDFKGYLSDIGGPSANMYKMKGIDFEICKKCTKNSCIYPSICKNLHADHQPMLELYNKIIANKNIKKAFIGSGIRYDLLLNKDPKYKTANKAYINQLISKHVSGRLKVAPEHTSEKVLKAMQKTSFSLFEEFKIIFDEANKQHGLKQELIPYFISSHPCSSEIEMAELAAITKRLNFKLEQIQDFTPTPMTLASTMYYTEYNPYTKEKVNVAKTQNEKLAQRKYFFWYKPEYRQDIKQSLIKAKREDLINKLFGK